MLYDNPHARRVVDLTAQSWLHIPISFGTAKEEELKRMTTELQPFAMDATWKSTKANRSLKLNVLKNGKKHTAKLLAGYLKTTK